MRLTCEVPHCGQTAAADGVVRWICDGHWQLVDRPLRRLAGRLHRLAQRDVSAEARLEIGRRQNRVWDRAREQAIERAAGI